jgi:hypothetical protein
MNPIYFQIHKVDEERREVTGRATQEIEDRDGEVMDYATSKPNFMSWSAEIYKDSGGLSHGNLRAMHGNICAGKLTDMTFDDTELAIDITAKVIDDNEWAKVVEGAYLGFSIGGRYTKKWSEVMGNKMVTKYTAMPNEISIVDRPSCSTAKFFSIHKRDGSVMKKRFKTNLSDYKSPFEIKNGKVSLTLDASKDAIRKIHSQGPLTLDGDFLSRKTVTNRMVGNDPVVKAIRRSHKDPLPASYELDTLTLSKAFDSRRLRKGVTFPPQSSNGISGGSIKDTAAANNWRDQTAARPKPAIIGGQVVTDVSRSPSIAAATAAIKQDLSKPKRLSV